jgi:uncharacterized protein
MLIEFKFSNYSCFEAEQTFSMVAGKDNTLPNNIFQPLERKDLRLSNTAIIYGANASGKSKFIDALEYSTNIVLESAGYKPEEHFNWPHFLLGKQEIDSALFEFSFIQEKIRYQYGFTLNRERILTEYLYAAPKSYIVKYFERSINSEGEEEYYFGNSFPGQNELIRKITKPNTLFLSSGATFKHDLLRNPFNWFNSFIIETDAPLTQLGAYFKDTDTIDDKYHGLIKELINKADFGIEDYKIYQTSPNNKNNPKIYSSIRFLHKNTRDDISKEIPLLLESSGTIRFLDLGNKIIDALETGKIIVIDEIDRSLHPLLTQWIIGLFNNPLVNKKNAQLIFNTHDVSLLESRLFRRDQIWFTEKENTGAAHLYSLLEFQPRKGELLGRGYLQGRYGAIPYLGNPSYLIEDTIDQKEKEN